jgi:predicted glycogen debranching enzyme
MQIDDRTEWLETDGLGGFASGTTAGIRTRRYHALLLAATTPPTGRMVLVNGLDAWVDTPSGSYALSTQRYAPDVLHPDGVCRITGFSNDPWPTWEYQLRDGTCVTQEILLRHGTGTAVIVWMLVRGAGGIRLRVRPFMSGRDYHALHHENGAFQFAARQDGPVIRLQPYDGVPAVSAITNGGYRHAPEWFRNFLYTAERERGLDDTEDLASPGELTWDLAAPGDEAVLMLDAGSLQVLPHSGHDVAEVASDLRTAERRRRAAFTTPLDRAADAYLVRRNAGTTILAGYPWFTDWGRDTFIAIRGLCLATGRLAEARDILVEWAGAVSQGMLPNRFADRGEAPEFNSVDASLWYVVAAGELLQMTRGGTTVNVRQQHALQRSMREIVSGYAKGTRYGIRMDQDGLLAAGESGVQLTWMDARVGDRVITPRIGKPVEVQALWLNALHVAGAFDVRWRRVFDRALDSFHERFWRDDLGTLADVVDVEHVAGTRDDTFRPNQILAVGGLPLPILEGDRARRVVDAIERSLVTPMGLRSLAPGEPGYARSYEGGPAARDAIYHQGTVWPWLIGPFTEAWVRVRGNTPKAKADARRRFVDPIMMHLESAGLGHVSEIADAESPFSPRGCPFQAWSLAELLRVDRVVLAAERVVQSKGEDAVSTAC